MVRIDVAPTVKETSDSLVLAMAILTLALAACVTDGWSDPLADRTSLTFTVKAGLEQVYVWYPDGLYEWIASALAPRPTLVPADYIRTSPALKVFRRSQVVQAFLDLFAPFIVKTGLEGINRGQDFPVADRTDFDFQVDHVIFPGVNPAPQPAARDFHERFKPDPPPRIITEAVRERQVSQDRGVPGHGRLAKVTERHRERQVAAAVVPPVLVPAADMDFTSEPGGVHHAFGNVPVDDGMDLPGKAEIQAPSLASLAHRVLGRLGFDRLGPRDRIIEPAVPFLVVLDEILDIPAG